MTQEVLYLCDVDGVLCNFAGTIMEACGVELDAELDYDWNIFKYFNPDQIKLMEKLCSDPDWWLSLPVYEGAARFMELIQSQCDRLLFVTSPWATSKENWQCKGWGWARNHWLKNHFGAGKDDVIITPSKYAVYGHRLFDDKFGNIKSWQNFQHKIGNTAAMGTLIDTSFNRTGEARDWPRRFSVAELNHVEL